MQKRKKKDGRVDCAAVPVMLRTRSARPAQLTELPDQKARLGLRSTTFGLVFQGHAVKL